MKKVYLPLTEDVTKGLKAGDEILLSGKLFTARDAAHKRLSDLIKKGKKLPIDLDSNIIYYCGPTPKRPNMPIGSCGPTTSKRMDRFTPELLARGLTGMIGKGSRSKQVKDAIKRYNGIYFIAIGGAGAYLASRVKKAMPVAYEDLGPEAIYELWVEDFPVIVAIDSKGRSI